MDIIFIVLAMVALLLLQGFFSGSEIAMVHADRLKLRHLASQGHRGAALVLKLFRRPEVLLGTTLVGTNMSVVALTTLATILMMHFFGEHGDVYAFLVFTPLFLVLGEVVPKSAYQQKADVFAPVIVYPLQLFSWVFYPVVFVFSGMARAAAYLAGVKMTSRELFVNREQLRSVVEMAERGANISVFDRDRIMRVMRYADMTVGEAMIPVAEMSIIGRQQTTRDAVRLARQRSHFRLPVQDTEGGLISGVVSFTLWDLMDPVLLERPLPELIKPVYNVTAHQLLDELLPVLQQRHDHMAIVIDEFGSAIGMITMEDILEEIVGEVMNVGYAFEGHKSRHKYRIEQLEHDVFLMDGRVPITEAGAVLDTVLPSIDAHTIGGMVISRLRHIPAVGEYVDQSGYRFTVEEVNDRGIQKVRVEHGA